MKAATQQYRFTAARGRSCAAHMQRRQLAVAGAVLPAAAGGINTVAPPAAPEVEVRDTASAPHVPRVLLIDKDADSAEALAALLRPEAQVIHAATLAEAQRLLRHDIFALVVLDPSLPDGNAATLLPLIVATPVLVYAQREPAWPQPATAFLPKPWTSQRRLWSTISRLLGVPTNMSAGD